MEPIKKQYGLDQMDESLETAIREAQAFELRLKEAPIPRSPLSPSEVDQLLAEAEAYGIDLSLLVRNLHLSPTERLEKLQGAADFILTLHASMRQGQHKES